MLRYLYVTRRDGSGVLFKHVQEYYELIGTSVEESIARAAEPHAKLSEFSVDLRAERELRRRRVWGAAVQMLANEIEDLPSCPRLGRFEAL